MEGPWKSEARALLRLAAPVAAIQIGMMAMGTVDVMMVGRVSAAAQAAVGLGNMHVFTLLTFGMGVLMALDPLVSQAIGAGDRVAARRSIQRGAALAFVLCVPTTLFALAARPVFVLLEQPDDVVELATVYVHTSAPSFLAFLLFVLCRQSLQALHRVGPMLLAIVVANGINLLCNWALIFGNLGFPALGIEGSAWATVVSRWSMLGMLLWFGGWRLLRDYLVPLDRAAMALRATLRQIGIGLPVGLQLSVELGAFYAILTMMGWFSKEVLAGHQVALNLAAMSFMPPLGIAAASAVRVGHAVGRRDRDGARRAAAIALGATTAMMLCFAAVFLLLPDALARLYSPDLEVVAVAATLIPIAGVFQLADGLQVVCSGILRGVGETRRPMLAHVSGFWLVGIPAGYVLGHTLGVGPEGCWWGLAIGLAAVAVLLLIIVRRMLSGPLHRVDVEAPAAPAQPAAAPCEPVGE